MKFTTIQDSNMVQRDAHKVAKQLQYKLKRNGYEAKQYQCIIDTNAPKSIVDKFYGDIMAKKEIRAVHMPIWVSGFLTHTATIRSDWKPMEYKIFAERFKNGYTIIRTSTAKGKIIFLHELTKYKFAQIEKWQFYKGDK